MIISKVPWEQARIQELEDWVSSGMGIYIKFLEESRDAILMEHGRRSIDPTYTKSGEADDALENARKFQVAIDVFQGLATGQFVPESVSSVAGEL